MTLNDIGGQPATLNGNTFELHTKRDVSRDSVLSHYKSGDYLAIRNPDHNYGMLGKANSLLYVNTSSSVVSQSLRLSSSVAYLPILCSSRDYLPMLPAMADDIDKRNNKRPQLSESGGEESSNIRAITAHGLGGSLQDLQGKQTCSHHEQELSHSLSIESICSHCRNQNSISSTSQLSSVVAADEEDIGGRSFPKHLLTRQNTYQNTNGFSFTDNKLARRAFNDSGVVNTP